MLQNKQKKLDFHLEFPLFIGNFRIKKLTWSDFKAKPDFSLPWSAHIYWTIQYTCNKKFNSNRSDIRANVIVLPTSWAKKQFISQLLLEHENGHYLIGCLCALEFIKKLQRNKIPISYNYTDYVRMVFNLTLREHIKLEKKYDQQTEHKLNREKQIEWNNFLYNKIRSFIKTKDEEEANKTYLKKRKTFTSFDLGKRKIKKI